MGIQTAPAASLLCASLIRGEALPELAGSIPADFAPADSRALALAPRVGLGAGERVGAVVLGMAAVALDPMPFDSVRLGGVEQRLPQLGILDRLPVGGRQPLRASRGSTW
jgi:hypothetical protein